MPTKRNPNRPDHQKIHWPNFAVRDPILPWITWGPGKRVEINVEDVLDAIDAPHTEYSRKRVIRSFRRMFKRALPDVPLFALDETGTLTPLLS